MVDFVCYGRGDARTLDYYDFARGPAVFYDQTATSFKVAYGNGNVTEFEGYGFAYDPSTGAPIAGTTTYGLRTVNGEPFGMSSRISITMQQAAAYIAMNDPQAVNRDIFKGNDRITGSIYDDWLDGWGGSDWLYGGAGNDTYVVDTIGDRIVEGAGSGTDTVRSSVSYTLATNVENLVLLGTGNINATGNTAVNTLTGNAGANTLNGGAGADLMQGLGGNDTYVVDNAGDRIVEAKGAGADKVLAGVSYALAAGQEIESLATTAVTGTGAINFTGNEFANTIAGNAGANVLDGGLGADKLTGGAGADTFVFKTALSTANIDHVTDFVASTATVHDTIQLAKSVFTALSAGTLAATAFKDLSVAGAKLDADDRILYNKTTGALSYDADGSGTKAAVQFAVIDTKVALTAADFFVV